jgi:undecaprenyl-diphosphatase
MTARNRHDVALVRGTRAAWSGLRRGWRSLPAAARRRWLVRSGWGLAAALLLTAALTLGAERLDAAGRLAWEEAWLRDFERNRRLSFHSALWLQALGASTMIVPIVALGAALAALGGRSVRALGFLAAYVPVKLLTFLGWWLWSRPRPDFIADGMAVPPALHSFPSGHVLQSVTVYGLLAWCWARASGSALERAAAWLLAAAAVALVAASRLRLGAHWPSDVAAGIAIGLVWLGVIVAAERSAESLARPEADPGAAAPQ